MLSNDMASLSKHPLSPLGALFLCLIVFFGGIAVRGQEASVTPLPAAPKAGTQADFIAAADEVLNQMSEITGLKLRAPLKKSLRSREEIRAFVIKQMNEEKNPAERYAHALEDQHFQIEAWVKAARPNEDAELARDAVLEGSAMAAMVDYLMLGTGRSLKDLPDFDPGILIGDLGSTPTLQKAPPFIKDALIFPYLGGLNFTAAVLKDTGWPGLPALFEKPPVSTQQILHPALYRSGKTPPNVTLPQLEKLLGANWSKLDENALGEFGWKEVLKQFLGEDRAKPLAAAWDGDRYVLYEQKQNKKLVLVTRLQLDSEEHAARFFGQYSEALEKKHSQRSNLFRRPSFFSFDTLEGRVFLDCFNKECVTLEGATRGVFDGLTKALGWPSAQQPPERPGAVSEKTATVFRRTEKSSIRHLDEPKTPSNLSLAFEEGRPHLAAFSGNGGVFAPHHEKRQVVRLLDSFTEAAQIG